MRCSFEETQKCVEEQKYIFFYAKKMLLINKREYISWFIHPFMLSILCCIPLVITTAYVEKNYLFEFISLTLSALIWFAFIIKSKIGQSLIKQLKAIDA